MTIKEELQKRYPELYTISEDKSKWNKGQINLAKAVEKLNKHLHTLTEPDDIEFGMYETEYYDLKELKEFYGKDTAWDAIEKEVKDDGHLVKVRGDEKFKGYYKLRMEIDRLKAVAM